MNKSNEKLNMLKDIGVFEYVADNQSETEKANFENALAKSENLRDDVASEEEFRALIEKTNIESPVSKNNIDHLFERIDNEAKTEKSNVIAFSAYSKYKPAAGFAIAASLVIAVFFSINFNNDLLEPKFQTLTSGDSNDQTDIKTLSSESRLIKIVLNKALPDNAIAELLSVYKLQSLGQQDNEVTVYSNHPMSNEAITLIQKDFRIKQAELINLNTRIN